jgi:tellurite resistance-related uncharacterized protein
MSVLLRRNHRLAASTWGLLAVHHGSLRFVRYTIPAIDVEIAAGSTQMIPPEIDHYVQPLGKVRFSIEFWVVDHVGSVAGAESLKSDSSTEEGGDPACWAGLLCADCGVVLGDGSHRPGCAFIGTNC